MIPSREIWKEGAFGKILVVLWCLSIAVITILVILYQTLPH